MHVTDLLQKSPLARPGGREHLRERIAAMPTGDLDREARERIEEVYGREEVGPDELRDAVSTALMDAFRRAMADQRSGRAVFGLLYELNASHLIVQVAGRLRRYGSKADPGDVLQEVFFNVYRYPHRFDAARDDAFRVWSAMIVRNTVLKHMRSRRTGGGNGREVGFEDLSDQSVADGHTPLTGALEREESAQAARAYVTYLQLYLEFYSMLSDRERRALHLVEVERTSYREAAEDLGIKLENLKMVIFRARRKIHRAMRRVFDGLAPDCKPARVGRTEADRLQVSDRPGAALGSSSADSEPRSGSSPSDGSHPERAD
ncbi:MAG: sigma-70 family RNA polymerase sigma factor [Planctomycetota bacterium]